jgi:hypothetical protein
MTIQLRLIHQIALIVIPVVFLYHSMLGLYYYGPFFLTTTDPEYLHLLNGINIALFDLNTPYIAHPGTTIQVTIAIAAWIINPFIPGDMIHSVIQNPEIFVKGSIALKNLYISGMLFFIGRWVLKYTGLIALAILFQSVMFGQSELMYLSYRMAPESMLAVAILLLIFISLMYILDPKSLSKQNKYILLFALVSGFGMATKFSFVPYVLAPIFVIKGLKNKLKYLFFSAILSLLMGFTLLFNIKESFQWFSNMLIHKGKWGSGETGFIDADQIVDRLWSLINVDQAFFAILLITLSIGTAVHFSRNKSHATGKTARLMTGLSLSTLILYFLVTKHYAVHYMFPALVLKITFIGLLFLLIKDFVNNALFSKIIASIILILTLSMSWQSITASSRRIENLKREKSENLTYIEHMKTYVRPNHTLILKGNYSGTPFVQHSLFESIQNSGLQKKRYDRTAKELFPNTLVYVPWAGELHDLERNTLRITDIDPEIGTILYIDKDQQKHKEEILHMLQNTYPDYQIEADTLINVQNTEQLYSVTFNKVSHATSSQNE